MANILKVKAVLFEVVNCDVRDCHTLLLFSSDLSAWQIKKNYNVIEMFYC